MPPRVPDKRPGKSGGKRDENRRRRIKQISDAAVALFLEHGISAVTIDQIVGRAKIAKGSFYRYFDDKTQLVDTLFEPFAVGIRAAMDDSDRALDQASTADLAGVYLRLASGIAAAGAQRDLLMLYLQENRLPAVGARAPIRRLADDITAHAIKLSEKARDLGLLSDSDPRIGALTVVGAVERLLFAFLSDEDLGEPAQVPAAVIRMILDGVRGEGR